MTQETESVETRPTPPPLKVVEPRVDPDDPWSDDVLDRKEVADRLANIVREQDVPFVISVDGGWGTGKTFLLNRWRQELENQGWEAIYFNAWKDDFSDDPLLAIIGQFSDYFDDGALKQLALAVAGAALAVLTKHLTGTPVTLEDLKPEGLLEGYREQHKTKDLLRDELASLASAVKEETGQPLVFIIDELDRCRPTFAIELLERVKHIFDVDNIVFVFGINRSELVKSLESVYGEIDAGTYLRRFFDMEFTLPDPNPAQFCSHLVSRYRLVSFVNALASRPAPSGHPQEFQVILQELPFIFGNMALSLRDMDYCVRLLALAVRDLEPRYSLYPMLVVTLVALKITNPDLYRRFVHGDARGGEVIDYMEKGRRATPAVATAESAQEERILDRVEAAVYCADDADRAIRQLEALMNSVSPEPPLYVSQQVAAILGKDDPGYGRLETLRTLIARYGEFDTGYAYGLRFLAQKVDLYYGMTKR